MKHVQPLKSSTRFKQFHDLMQKKVRHILLISTSYEAWIMEEDCRISEQIVHEYRGLNLSQPPKLTWVSSVDEAVECISNEHFDLVITISSTVDLQIFKLCSVIKEHDSDMPVVLLTHQEVVPVIQTIAGNYAGAIDHIFFWSGQADILLAIVKCIEDRLNIENDIGRADVRVILFVEDSPYYLSSMLPVLYKELVDETQSVIDDGLNEEHRLLTMRARPKILVAHSYEEALDYYQTFNSNILGVISDVRYSRKGRIGDCSGIELLQLIKKQRFDIPLLLASSEPHNAKLATEIPASFIDKNTPYLHDEIREFMETKLGFGPFFFTDVAGNKIDQANSLYEFELSLAKISHESFLHHCRNNDFSRWLFSLVEVDLASTVRTLLDENYDTTEEHRQHLVRMIRTQRIQRQKGVVVNFDGERFDPDIEFIKTGKGSLGGKARGLAFFAATLHENRRLFSEFPNVEISVPQSFVITTECFDAFIEQNELGGLVKKHLPDEEVSELFLNADFPEPFASELTMFLDHVNCPLAVRSSSLLEDAKFKSYAGLYDTYIISNDQSDSKYRYNQLLLAIKKVYASTFFEAPKSFSKRVGNKTENEKMAVIIQCAVGSKFGQFYYPAVSGVAQSMNYYPFLPLTTDDGIVNIVLGFGKAVTDGENALRFSPRHPEILPQRSSVDDILRNVQTGFYALRVDGRKENDEADRTITLHKRNVGDARDEFPVRLLSSIYDPAEHRIRDSFTNTGYQVLTFASLLKYKSIPFTEILETVLALGKEKLGCPVEIEFAVDFGEDRDGKTVFSILQIRPMSAREELLEVEITEDDFTRAFCISESGLGNTVNQQMTDIIYIKPECYDPAKNLEIAQEIGKINSILAQEGRKYVLIGPGRWGSSDHWLGIPVSWVNISEVGGIVETIHEKIHVEPSQGSHFFHNITTLGINYLNVSRGKRDHLDYDWLRQVPVVQETEYIAHVRSPGPITLKVDGRTRVAVMLSS